MADKLRIDNNDLGSDYEPTDSEDNYSDEEKELLQNARESRRRKQLDGKKELLAFKDSDDSDEDNDDIAELMRDSDIEGATDDDNDDDDEDLPESKDWGSKARNYYGTDFNDPDFSTWTAEEEAMAKLEEEEARKIQTRLLKEMREEDFVLDDFNDKEEAGEEGIAAKQDKGLQIGDNIAGLALSEQQRLLKKDSPEFAGLMEHFSDYFADVKLITPVLAYATKHNVPIIPALKFAKFYNNLALTYCSNITFYLLIKAKRLSVKTHPITIRLVQLRRLLKQLEDKYENIIKPQLEALLERIVDGDQFEVLPFGVTTKKTKLTASNLNGSGAESTRKRAKLNEPVAAFSDDELSDEEAMDDGENAEEQLTEQNTEDGRRGITYQIAKNKGLMPHRKAEQRNPRVKHRSKFRKALIRRKGAVRTVRKETKRYGGEISGIKATVSKSIKFKV